MHPIILVCGSFSNSSLITERLCALGVKTLVTTPNELTPEVAILDTDVLILSLEEKAPSKGILRFTCPSLRRPADTISNRRLISAAFRISALARVNANIESPPPPPLEFITEKLEGMKIMEDFNFFFKKPKSVWPKAKHTKPSANWKHRPSACHPARSRAKGRMR